MKFFADLHVHSRYSRGTHPDMEIPTLVKWAKIKGIGLLGTGDFTHPQWLVELKKFLKPASGRGIYEYDDVKFLLTGEVSAVYTRGGRTYKIHHVIFAPNFMAADRLIDALAKFGDVQTEARPTLNLSAEDLVKAVLDAAPDALVVPAHAWGLWHSLFSPQFGYASFAEAYGSQAGNVRVFETGLCADPAHIRRISALDGRTLFSSSDAHHPQDLGREAAIFDCPVDYKDITAALLKNDRSRFIGTVEMFPEENRTYASGHRACQTRADKPGQNCKKCGKPFAPGVAELFDALSDRKKADAAGLAETAYRLVSLRDIIADVLGFQPDAETVQRQYLGVTQMGPELEILLNWPEERLRKELPIKIAESVLAQRRGDVSLESGFDGLPGRVRINIPKDLPEDAGQLKLL